MVRFQTALKRLNLQARIVLGALLISLVPLFILFFYSVTSFQDTLKQAAATDLKTKTYLAAEVVDHYLNSRISEMKILADSDTLRGKDAAASSAYLTEVFKESGNFIDFNLFDLAGNGVASTNVETDLGHSYDNLYSEAQEYFVKAKTAGRGAVVMSEAREVDEGVTVLLLVPVVDKANVITRVLVAEIEPAPLLKLLNDFDDRIIGKQYVSLVDSDHGHLLFSKDPAVKSLEQAPDLAVVPTMLNRLKANDANGSLNYTNSAKIPVIAGYANVGVIGGKQPSNWALIAVEPVKDVIAPATALRNLLTILVLLLALVVGVIAYFFSQSVAGFILNPVRDAVGKVLAIGQSLAASAQQTTAASIQNANVSKQMASGAVEQSRQAEEVSKSIAQISATTQQISASAEEAAATAVKTSQIAQDAGVSSEKVGKAVDAITTVSEQTNLLALNAAIEAARAGEAGRGFAVVADEVRKLAEGSGKSATEIKDVVRGISEASKNAVIAAQDTASKIQELSNGTQQQSAAITQVARNMDAIASVAEQNASGVQQLSASIQQQSSSNQQVAAAAAELSELSEVLQNLTGASRKKPTGHTIQPPEETLILPTLPETPVVPEPHKVAVAAEHSAHKPEPHGRTSKVI